MAGMGRVEGHPENRQTLVIEPVADLAFNALSGGRWIDMLDGLAAGTGWLKENFRGLVDFWAS
jgi:hypothetical protein